MKTLPYDDPGTPDLRSPLRLLLWVLGGQWRTQLVAAAFGIAWMVLQALFPAAVSRAIDEGIVARDDDALWRWGVVLLLLGVLSALCGAGRHRYSVENWLRSSFRAMQLIGQHTARAGEALPRTLPTGEVVATVASDVIRLGGLYDVSARFVGAVVSYGVVAVLLLGQSVPLGLVILLGLPVVVATLSLIVRPLQQRQAHQREESGRLTTLGADTVAGLRVLRGIGGEQTFLGRYVEQSQRVRRVGVHVAGVQATLEAAQVLLPGCFVVLVTWLGARFALQGGISVGQLVAFYGYTAFLVIPLRTTTEFADRATRAVVAARKIIRVLAVEPDHADAGAVGSAAADPDSGPLHDPASGVTVRPGRLTAVVSARPAESSALADRLGRFGPAPTPVTLGGTALSSLTVAQVRRRVVVSETDPRLFTGTLREELDPRGRHSDEEILEAVTTASGEDLLEALSDGLDSEVEERGRSFSGGQRQRLTLARALLTDAEVLVLVEPTSAVDAHTEARVAERLATARAGRTTVVMTASPLLLDRCDEVVLLQGGRAAAGGTHHELLVSCPAYRRVVMRGEED
ncbi:MAG TPA: ABC transporter ATP-binding protein [Segeticoccus sp.]|nr:ABC transporter ATP-binding protein [Segeticoccus sp.]